MENKSLGNTALVIIFLSIVFGVFMATEGMINVFKEFMYTHHWIYVVFGLVLFLMDCVFVFTAISIVGVVCDGD